MAINGKRRLPCKVALLRAAFKFSFKVEVVEKKSNHLECCALLVLFSAGWNPKNKSPALSHPRGMPDAILF
jgi:hypothetical protein